MIKKAVKLNIEKNNNSCVLIKEQECLEVNRANISLCPINFIALYHGEDYAIIKNILYRPNNFKAYCSLLSLIKSCFDGGYWDNNKPWLNDTAWKN